MAKGMILAGDVGGTKTNLAFVPATGRGRIGAPVAFESYRSADFQTFETMIEQFRGTHDVRFDAASFGYAGPVEDGRGVGTNVPWVADRAKLERALALPRTHVMNDLVATGYGIAALTADDLVPILDGSMRASENAGILAAGTGLGEAILAWVEDGHVPIASEGGHADFAPRTDLEIEVFRHLRDRFGRVSYEHIVSGPGLVNVGRVLHELTGAAKAWRAHEEQASNEDDLPQVVSGNALGGACPECAGALDLFVGVYGAEAGNLALRCVARGGIYLGGGIAPHILPALRSETFRAAFQHKPPHRELLESIPVFVIRNERTALLGAARFATL
jgi:glucokinase